MFIRFANAFLELYRDDREDILDPIMHEIHNLAKELKLPYCLEDDGESIGEWIIPTKKEMKEIIKRSERVHGDAG